MDLEYESCVKARHHVDLRSALISKSAISAFCFTDFEAVSRAAGSDGSTVSEDLIKQLASAPMPLVHPCLAADNRSERPLGPCVALSRTPLSHLRTVRNCPSGRIPCPSRLQATSM
jgi:hypothetical protein